LPVTAANAERNGVAGALTVSTTPLAEVDGEFDIVMANILAPALIALAPDLRRTLADDGVLIVSGMPRPQRRARPRRARAPAGDRRARARRLGGAHPAPLSSPSTSPRCGIDGTAPGRVVDSAAARSGRSAGRRPSRRLAASRAANAPQNVSPAAVVSTDSTVYGAMSSAPSGVCIPGHRRPERDHDGPRAGREQVIDAAEQLDLVLVGHDDRRTAPPGRRRGRAPEPG
jgi:hypothetical protein